MGVHNQLVRRVESEGRAFGAAGTPTEVVLDAITVKIEQMKLDSVDASDGWMKLHSAAAAFEQPGVQMLRDFDRSRLLGPLADYIPSTVEYQHWAEPCARQRFDSLLARVQQAQLQAAVQNELLVARRPDAVWWKDNSRFTLAPVSKVGKPGRVADPNAWAEFIREPERNSYLANYSLSVRLSGDEKAW